MCTGVQTRALARIRGEGPVTSGALVRLDGFSLIDDVCGNGLQELHDLQVQGLGHGEGVEICLHLH
jgi:hypothetical protein